MKLIVTTFLVYKVKKCLLKSGKVSLLKSRKVKEAFIRTCSSRGASMPKAWGHNAQAVGTQCPSRGDTMPKAWANLAHSYICGLTVCNQEYKGEI